MFPEEPGTLHVKGPSFPRIPVLLDMWEMGDSPTDTHPFTTDLYGSPAQLCILLGAYLIHKTLGLGEEVASKFSLLPLVLF